MKMGKEDIKKMILGGLGVAAAIYAYFTFLISPMGASAASEQAQIDALRPKMDAARKLIAETAVLEKQAPAAAATFEEIKSMIPAGAPVAWFPPRIVEFFSRQGMDAVGVRQDGEAPIPALPGFRSLRWTLELPKTQFIPLAIAISGLENEEPLLNIRALRITASGADVQHPTAVLQISTITTQ